MDVLGYRILEERARPGRVHFGVRPGAWRGQAPVVGV